MNTKLEPATDGLWPSAGRNMPIRTHFCPAGDFDP